MLKISEKTAKMDEIISKSANIFKISDFPTPYEALINAAEDKKRLILHELIKKVLISDDELEIVFKF